VGRDATPPQSLNIYPFGCKVPTKLESRSWTISLRYLDDTWFRLQAMDVPSMGSPLVPAPVPWQGKKARFTEESRSPDILIGIKDFWKIF
jgi:hypothetical protein